MTRLLAPLLVFALHTLGNAPVRAAPEPEANHFLIVAPERFHHALASFVAHKNQRLPTRLIALEHALGSATRCDDPEKLKRFLHLAWREERVRYVLLVGDADILPVRYMVLDRITSAAFDYAFYPSDLYYSDLAKSDGAFDDWNARQDGFHAGYFGEVRGEKNKDDPINFDAVDYRPEIAVGRWPVSTEAEVAVVASKTIRYENDLLRGAKPGARDAIFMAVDGWVDSRPAMDGAVTNVGPGWKIEKRYYANRKRNDQTPPPRPAQLISLLTRGAGLVFHAGHGTDDTWERCFFEKDRAGLRNADRLPVMMSVGCSTARFATLPPYEAYIDIHGAEHRGTNAGQIFREPPPPPAPYQSGRFNPPGLGEKLLRAGPDGAVAYLGCNTGSQPCGLTLLEGFTRAIGIRSSQDGPLRLGDCWADAIAHYYEKERLASLAPDAGWYPASIFFQGMKFMLFGDPTLVLPD